MGHGPFLLFGTLVAIRIAPQNYDNRSYLNGLFRPLFSPHLPQKSNMRSNRIPDPRVLDIHQSILLASLPDDLTDRGIMYVRYLGKKMVFDLEVQAADQPGHDRIAGGEIGRRLDLVYRPFVLHLAGDLTCQRERCMLDRVRQLEDHAQHKPSHHRHDRKTDQPVIPAEAVDRERNKNKSMDDFETPEHKMIIQAHLLERHDPDPALKIFHIIHDEYPEDIEDAVKEPKIQVLIPVQLIFFLGLAHPHPGLGIDIVIYACYIRIRMMHDVMFHIPHETVASQDVQRKSSDRVHYLVFRKTAMSAIVHDIKTDRRRQTTQQDTLQNSPKCIGGKKDQVDIDEGKTQHQDDRLHPQVVIARRGRPYFLKIVTDPFFQLSVKRLGSLSEFRQRHIAAIDNLNNGSKGNLLTGHFVLKDRQYINALGVLLLLI